MNMEFQELQNILQENGIVGAGGAGFPSYMKLNKKADTILLNCAECEPLLKLHQQLLEHHTVEILSVLHMISTVLEVTDVCIGIKSEYTSTIESVELALPSYQNMRIQKLNSIYPTGDEVVLIYESTGKVVRPGGLPIEEGIIVFNVETIYNIYCALHKAEPVISKLITVVGEVSNPITVRVPIGTSVESVVALAGKTMIEDPAYLLGGAMMGTLGSGKQPITKTTNAILVLKQDHLLVLNRKSSSAIHIKRVASACCQCECCTDLCSRCSLGHPIKPHLFMRAIANNDFKNLDIFLNTFFCSGCGICELYACPQGLSPRTLIMEYKAGLRKAGVQIPKDRTAVAIKEARQYQQVPEHRLEARIGLTKYHKPSPLHNHIVKINRVQILLSQHIGSPAIPVVSKGDIVVEKQLIAKQGSGLSVAIHASITGKILEITDKFIMIQGE